MTQNLIALDQVGARRTGSHKGGRKQIYILDEPGRNLIRAVYGNPEYGNVSESIDYLVKRLGFTRVTITRYAQSMGLSRTRDNYWTSEEIAYLEEYYQKPAGKRASIKSIAKHLGRTEAAVRLKAKRMKFRRVRDGNYSIRALSDALGCDFHKVERWIQKGWMYAEKDRSRENVQYAITPKEVRRFILAHPSEIDHRRADWIWLLDILVGGTDRIGEAQYSRKQDEEVRA